MKFMLHPCGPYDFRQSVGFLIFAPGEPVDLWEDHSYWRVLELGGSHKLVRIHSVGTVEKPILEVDVKGGRASDREAAEPLLAHTFSLSWDPSSFYERVARDPPLAEATVLFRGLKPTRFPSLFETLVISILAQQINLRFATTLKSRLVQRYGPQVTFRRRAYFGFPTPEALAHAKVEQLRKMQFSARKAEYIIGLARAVCSGKIDLDALAERPDAEVMTALMQLRGIGPTSAQWALWLGLGRPDVFPTGDLGLQKALARFYFGGKRRDEAAMRQFSERWAGFRSHVTLYLYARQRAIMRSPPAKGAK